MSRGIFILKADSCGKLVPAVGTLFNIRAFPFLASPRFEQEQTHGKEVFPHA